MSNAFPVTVVVVDDESIALKTLKVVLKKIAAVSTPLAPTPHAEDFIPGADNPGVSLPIEYTVEGVLITPIVIGQRVMIDRTKRNGIEVPGWFESTPVKEIKGNIFTTANSVYQIEYL
jgi:hypothetical protein